MTTENKDWAGEHVLVSKSASDGGRPDDPFLVMNGDVLTTLDFGEDV